MLNMHSSTALSLFFVCFFFVCFFVVYLWGGVGQVGWGQGEVGVGGLRVIKFKMSQR